MTETMQLPMFDVIEIPLTKGYVTVIDPIDADLATLSWHVDGYEAYATRYCGGGRKAPRFEYLHCVILERVIGRPLNRNERCDHKDTNPLNNRRTNLRLSTAVTNEYNSGPKKNNKSGYKGVCWDKRRQKWHAQIAANGIHHCAGFYADIIDAARAYDAAALKYHGEFARTNVMLGLLPPLDRHARRADPHERR